MTTITEQELHAKIEVIQLALENTAQYATVSELAQAIEEALSVTDAKCLIQLTGQAVKEAAQTLDNLPVASRMVDSREAYKSFIYKLNSIGDKILQNAE